MAKLQIKLVRSTIGTTPNQRKNVEALGLRKREQVVVKEDNAQIRGMITKVKHLVEVTEIAAVKAKRRLGRGTATGQGKTAGRGQKGQWSRSGGGVRVGFEGGQMPLARRLPKRGFSNPNKKVFTEVNVELLNRFENGTVVTAELLKSTGAIAKIEKDGVKILGEGNLERAITVQAAKFTASAQEKIEKAGGKAELV